jgi:hypothetical protein
VTDDVVSNAPKGLAVERDDEVPGQTATATRRAGGAPGVCHLRESMPGAHRRPFGSVPKLPTLCCEQKTAPVAWPDFTWPP